MFQHIYTFNKCINALDESEVKGDLTLFLTTTFRFGPEVAAVATK